MRKMLFIITRAVPGLRPASIPPPRHPRLPASSPLCRRDTGDERPDSCVSLPAPPSAFAENKMHAQLWDHIGASRACTGLRQRHKGGVTGCVLTCLSLLESAVDRLVERAFLAAAWSRLRCLRVFAVLVLMAPAGAGGASSAILGEAKLRFYLSS